MNLYALLIGINDYPNKPLSQCINDVNKVEHYIESISSTYSQVHLKKIFDSDAKKAVIVSNIKNFLSEATDNDVCLLYYSGHGAQENAGGVFSEEHDNMLECLVAHYDENQTSGFLLADKEIRYLFSDFRHSPHLITVFDCCHSGDIFRSLGDDGIKETAKRLAKPFPTRNFKEFIFSDQITKDKLRQECLASLIPFKNHIHLAACLSDELSWETEKGGVFTNYLLQLLSATHSQLSYGEIAKWARIGLKDTTNKKQTPTINIHGEGKLNTYASWLNLFPERTHITQAKVLYNAKNGWYYTRGLLMGIKKGMPVTVQINVNEKINTVVTSAGFEFSRLKMPENPGIELDQQKEYKANTNTSYSRLKVFVNDMERAELTKGKIESCIREQPGIEISEAGAADFYINIFNQMVYISLPGDEFRPLSVQIDLLNQAVDFRTLLRNQLSYVIKWNHFNTLYNADNSYDRSPIKVELDLRNGSSLRNITNAEYFLEPETNRDGSGRYYTEFAVKVTNITHESVFIGVLVLNSDFGISAKPFDQLVIQLDPGQSKYFYDHTGKAAYVALDHYQEIYNWKSEWFSYLFIVNNNEDFTTSLSDFVQPGLEQPLLATDALRSANTKSEGSMQELHEVNQRWGTIKSTIHLKNPGYNIISGILEESWEKYSKDEKTAPFIGMLYFAKRDKGFVLESEGKPNRANQDQANRGFMDITINILNFLDNKRRLRIFKGARTIMPDKPVIVAEGDSWFLYPFLVKDTIDYVMEKFPVRSIAAAGDTLDNYMNSQQLIKEVAIIRPEYVMISGGGNDIIGPGIVNILRTDVDPGRNPEEYLNDHYKDLRKKLLVLYEYFFTELKLHRTVKRVFVHGYDYVRADHKQEIIKNGWVNKYMIEYGIKNTNDRERLIKYLVDNFNNDLEELAKKHDNAIYVNMRGLINHDEWFDEIHPNFKGFAKIGNSFISKIEHYMAF